MLQEKVEMNCLLIQQHSVPHVTARLRPGPVTACPKVYSVCVCGRLWGRRGGGDSGTRLSGQPDCCSQSNLAFKDRCQIEKVTFHGSGAHSFHLFTGGVSHT